jgi:hypothetical protein
MAPLTSKGMVSNTLKKLLIQRIVPCSEAARWIRRFKGTPQEMWEKCRKDLYFLLIALWPHKDNRRRALSKITDVEYWTSDNPNITRRHIPWSVIEKQAIKLGWLPKKTKTRRVKKLKHPQNLFR